MTKLITFIIYLLPILLLLSVINVATKEAQIQYLQENLDWSNDLRHGYEDFASEKFNCREVKPSDQQACLLQNINNLNK